MRSNYIKIKTACLITSVIVIASVRAQQYGGYNNNYARQQYYPQYPQSPKASSTQQYLAFPSVSSAHPVPAARPPVPSQSAFSLNARQNFGLTKQIVQGSEQFTFDMIYVSLNLSHFKGFNDEKNLFVNLISILNRQSLMRFRIMI